MTPEIVTEFLTGYIRSLREETRQEVKGARHGFDRIIYELALASDLIPARLSFFRQGDSELASPKKEAEHGVDQSFLSRDRTTLWVFVLKDETLTYRNWTAHGFDTDLRMARDQDLSNPDLISINAVRVVLTYNKDDNEEGIECFDRFVSGSGSKIGDAATLSFERWNLTTITEKVRERLLTPALLPESFFKRFTYLCWQIGDFEHGSPQWNEVLLPDWREFLSSVLASPANERSVRLISVALIILRSYGKKDSSGEYVPSFATGWIDLLEWAMVSLWNAASESGDDVVLKTAFQIWIQFYVTELERFYETYKDILLSENSLESSGDLFGLEGVSTYHAYWHMARMGLLSATARECLQFIAEEAREQIAGLEVKTTNWIVQLLNSNPSCQRPLLDIQHIEIFLVSTALIRLGRWDDLLRWYESLFERLLYRRLGKGGCRIIDYGNSWDILFEYLATGEEPHAGFGRSSYLLLMILEIALAAPSQQGEGLVDVIYRQLIMAENGEGGKFPFKEEVRLMGWIPPKNWSKRILREKVEDGFGVSAFFTNGVGELSIATSLRRFVDATREDSKIELSDTVLPSVLVLPCLKRISPLPNEFWRGGLYAMVSEM